MIKLLKMEKSTIDRNGVDGFVGFCYTFNIEF